MEDNIQTIIGVIISVFLLFIFPVYMAYEKKDDISYALAMRYTQDFVDEVRRNGYITSEQLASYKSKLLATGNSFDVQLTHKQTRIDPITQYYKNDALDKTGTQEERKRIEDELLKQLNLDPNNISKSQREFVINQNKYSKEGYTNVVDTYQVSEEVYNTNYIEKVLELENKLWINATTDNFECVDATETEVLTGDVKKINSCKYAYTMNEGDDFNVTIKNTNTTLATMLYNMVTAHTVDNNTRIYVNYGGTILDEKWYGKIDYSKMKQDEVSLEEMELIETKYKESPYLFNRGTVDWLLNSSGLNYIIEFEAKPLATTDLREVGYKIKREEWIGNDWASLYNPAIAYSRTLPSGEYYYKYNGMENGNVGGLAISVGINGVCIVIDYPSNGYNSKSIQEVLIAVPMTISDYVKIKVKVNYSETTKSGSVKLYINDKKVGENNITHPARIDAAACSGFRDNINTGIYSTYHGYLRNLKLYY